MSRGPGALQRRVLETLETYRRLGPSLGWCWSKPADPYSLGNYVMADGISAYEAGRRVPVWILLRDLECSRDELSRALKGLERQGLVSRYNGGLGHVGASYPHGEACKFACITAEGEAWLKRQQPQDAKVGAYPWAAS